MRVRVTPSAPGEALLVVDPQVDFYPAGALAVPGGDRIFAAVNRAMREHPLVVAIATGIRPAALSPKSLRNRDQRL